MNLIRKQQNFLPFVFDNFFRDTWDIMPAINNSFPATNIKESDKDFIIEFAIPGKSNEDFEIELDNQLLTVKSNHNAQVMIIITCNMNLIILHSINPMIFQSLLI